MPDETRDPRSVVQGAYRRRRGWTIEELAAACGDSKAVVAINETVAGSPPALKTLKARVEAMGYAPSIVDLAVEVVDLAPVGDAAPGSPLDAPPEEKRTLRERALRFGVRAFRLAEGALKEKRYRHRVAEQRAQAQGRVEELLAQPSTRWRLLIAGGPRYQSWAVVERLCDLSEIAASDDVKRALSLAELALYAAEYARGPASWRDRLSGMAWAFVGNAKRVASDHRGADEAFRTAWTLWKKGFGANLPLGDWRLFDLEASLRRAERLWSEAVDLHQRALATAPESAQGSILVKLAYTFDQMFEPDRSLATLLKAEPLVELSGDPRLPLVFRFNLVTTLLALGRLDEAEARLPEVRERAVALGRELDLVRTLWLQGRLDAARGQRARALAALEQVMWGFRERDIAYDTALVGLEVAALYLETGAAGHAQRLSSELVWVFAAHQINREALAALRVFCDAAEADCLTAEIARQAAADFRQAGSPSALSGGE